MNQDKSDNDKEVPSNECCSEASKISLEAKGPSCCGSSHRSQGKTMVFALIVFAALAAASYSIYKSNQRQANVVSCGVTLKSVDAVREQFVGKHVIFLFLTDGEKSVSSSAGLVEKAIQTLSEKGKLAAAVTLAKNGDGFNELKEQYSIKTLPAVIVIGRAHAPILVNTANITERNLVNSGIQASSYCCTTPCN